MAGLTVIPRERATATGTGITKSYILPASEDAWVKDGDSADHGTSNNSLKIRDNNTAHKSYLKFELPAFASNETLSSAYMRLYTPREAGDNCPSSTDGVDVYAVGSSWGEDTIVWEGAPVAGSGSNPSNAGGSVGQFGDSEFANLNVEWTQSSVSSLSVTTSAHEESFMIKMPACSNDTDPTDFDAQFIETDEAEEYERRVPHLIIVTNVASEASTDCPTYPITDVTGLLAAVNDSDTTGETHCIAAGNYQLPAAGRLEPDSGDRLIGEQGTLTAKNRAVAVNPEVHILASSTSHQVIDWASTGSGLSELRWLEISGAQRDDGPTGTCTTEPTMGPCKSTGRGINADDAATAVVMRYLLVHDNESTGIAGLALGSVLDHSELHSNGSAAAQGSNSGGVKSSDPYTVRYSYVHDNLGNGVWCDSGCYKKDVNNGPTRFYVYANLIVKNYRNGMRVENSPQDADEWAKAYLRDNDVWENNCVDGQPWETGQDTGIMLNDARHVDVLYNDLNGGQINGTGTTYGHNCESDGSANDIKLGGSVLDGEGEVAEFDGLLYKYDTVVENISPVIEPPDCDPIPDIQVYCRGN